MNDTPAPTPPVTPTPASAAPTPSIQINMPKQRGRWLSRLMGTCLIVAIVTIIYMGGIIGAITGGPMSTATITEGEPTQVLAVYNVEGMIDTEQASNFATFVREMEKNESIKAVLVRVNSPGGAVAPSDQMNAGMRRIKAAGKKLVVSMGGVAASGGYYLSAPAEFIYAEPTTITGSIGVISQMPILVGTMEKIGMQMQVIRSTQAEQFKARLNPVELPTPEAIAEHKDLLDKIQLQFMAAVANGRTMLTAEEVETLSNGQVWLGAEAKERKLVDEIGYFDDAVAKAATMASLSKPHVVKYSLRKGVLSKMLGGGASTGLQIDANLLDEIQTPRFLMIWRP